MKYARIVALVAPVCFSAPAAAQQTMGIGDKGSNDLAKHWTM